MNNEEKEKHLNQFSNGGTLLTTESAYNDYMRHRSNIGYCSSENDPHGSMFVAPKEDIDKILKESNGDVSKVEKALGFPEGHFGDGSIIRVDIPNPQEHGLRMANGRESGSNEFFNTNVDANGKLPDIQYVKDVNGNNTRIVDSVSTDPSELAKLKGQYWDEKGNYHAPNLEGYKGTTSQGIPEAVINQVPNRPEDVSYTRLDGFKRGESSTTYETSVNNGYAPANQTSKDNIEKLGVPHSNAPPFNDNSDYSSAKSSELKPKPSEQDAAFSPVSKGELKAAPNQKDSFQSVTADALKGKVDVDSFSKGNISENAIDRAGSSFSPSKVAGETNNSSMGI